MYMLTVTNENEQFYLRGTVWAFRPERAFIYETETAARAALETARPFMPTKVYKAAQLIEVI